MNKNKRSEKKGEVYKISGEKTAIVNVHSRKLHNRYYKIIQSNKKYMVHFETVPTIGEKVVIVSCKPISKRKKWRIKEMGNT
ncbi:MAG: 30S ribosomal protein S17 [bacterium]